MAAVSLGRFLVLPFLIRICIVLLTSYLEKRKTFFYTDVDYAIYFEAAEHVITEKSPYDRSTYRYTPLLAYAMIPSVLLFREFGKILFCLVDCAVGYFLLLRYSKRAVSFSWLYNPYVISISTRGSSDCIICLLVVCSLYCWQAAAIRGVKWSIIAGIVYGFSIHFKIFPIIFAIPFAINWLRRFAAGLENRVRLILKLFVFGLAVAATIGGFTFLFWKLYGYKFLFEAYIYHFIRQDHRHNFSMHFYPITFLLERSAGNLSKIYGFLTTMPAIVCLLYSGVKLSTDALLPFGLFIQTTIFVAFNKVITAQVIFTNFNF